MDINTIHWLGVGLSSPPGIIELINNNYNIEVWNRSTEKAELLLHKKIKVKHLDLENLDKQLTPNDLIVSMLPANMHLEIANLAIKNKCHLLTSSYFDPKYTELEKNFQENDCLFMCEAGLDPGIDHLLAHKLVHDFQEKINYEDVKNIEFKSMCGGFPLIPNEFKYKFSWSPVGVIRALNTQAKYIKQFKEIVADRPYEHVSLINFRDENFETYPNRNSIPYINSYLLDSIRDKIKHFERGTIRLKGWTEAWQNIFHKINNKEDIEKLGSELWESNKYLPQEKDRVLLYVSLRAEDKIGDIIYDRTIFIDDTRAIENSSMSNCVSLTVYSTIECILKNNSLSGVKRIFSDINNVDYILNRLDNFGVKIHND